MTGAGWPTSRMPPAPPTVLVVDRPGAATTALIAFLRAHDMLVPWASDDESAFRALAESRLDGLVATLRAPGIDGMAVLRRARARHPDVCAVMTVAGAGRAGEAMREGAHDVIPKPVDHERLLAVLLRGLAHQRTARRLAELEGLAAPSVGARFTGRSRAIIRVVEQVRHLASMHAAVLIEGEVGTGKRLAARAIHEASSRRSEAFVGIDCGALDGSMIECELFGLESTASGIRPGRLEEADGGTLFLDEIGAAPHGVQVQLLRLLQDRAFERVGGQSTIRVDVRLMAATSRDLAVQVRAGGFRDDLFQRLAVARVAMPPLRERREDVPPLVEQFLRELGRAHRRRVRGVTRGVLERLQQHAWPGNVHELRNALESMVVSAPGGRPLDLADLPQPLRAGRGGAEPLEIAIGMTVGEAERLLIAATLEHVGHHKPRAAAMLGIGLRTLYRKIQECGIREARRSRPRSDRAFRTQPKPARPAGR